MELRVDDFNEGEEIPSKYTCDGENARPGVSWSDAPKGTKSFAFSCIDYDVPKNLRPDGVWTHWLVADIPASVKGIGGKEKTPGREIMNHFGRGAWGGPCPPDRRHNYVFIVYALGEEKVSEELTKENFREVMEKHALARAKVVGNYERKQ